MEWIKKITEYRDLVFFLVRTDIVQNYKQTIIGPLWAVIQPLILMVVFTFIFGKVSEINIGTNNIAYPIFVYSGMLPWNLMRTTVLRSSNALVANRNLVQRVYFPREFLVLVQLLSALFDFLIAFCIFIVLMLVFDAPFQTQMPLVIFMIFGISIMSIGIGFFLSALNARFRDVTQGIPYVIQVWMYISPVIYPPDFITGPLTFVNYINPMTGYLEATRGILLGTPFETVNLIYSFGLTLVVFTLGWLYFHHEEKVFVDML